MSGVRRPTGPAEDDAAPDPGGPLDRGFGPDDARVVLDFAVGTDGVGPAAGFDSGDFYPVASTEDVGGSRTDHRETEHS